MWLTWTICYSVVVYFSTPIGCLPADIWRLIFRCCVCWYTNWLHVSQYIGMGDSVVVSVSKLICCMSAAIMAWEMLLYLLVHLLVACQTL